ncbi:MAG TPA: hypothetical protein VFU47_09310 [Armatimonadota bacterium]|nr:hypothetical protein [Armatimonadota bacterium]
MDRTGTAILDWEAPEVELDAFIDRASEAMDLAHQGRIADGYERLAAGLLRAQYAAARGEPWAEPLRERYLELLACYREQYGVRLN